MLAIVSAGALCILLGSPAYAQSLETRAIALVKSTFASRLEAGLPRQRFADWLKAVVGPAATIQWELHDCGEQTGTAADAGRDFPACVGAAATLPDRRTVHVSVMVGTFKKGIVGSPTVRLVAIERRGEFVDVPRLRALPGILRKRPQ